MREINHMLIKHSVRVTQNKGVPVFVLSPFILVIKFLTCCCKEHGIYKYISTSNIALFTIKCFSKH